MRPSSPPLLRAPARDRRSEFLIVLAAALVASVSVPAGIGFGAVLLAQHLKATHRSLSAAEVMRYGLLALGAILLVQLLKDWPEAKQGFLDGWRQGRAR